jgi:hypothetical protein
METNSFFCNTPANYCFECGACHLPHQNTLCPLSTVFTGPAEERRVAIERLKKYLYQAVELLEDWSAGNSVAEKTQEFLNEVY